MVRNHHQSRDTGARSAPGGTVAPGNAAQAEAGNGADGEFWTRQQDRTERRFRHLTPHLLTAAGLRPESRVVDIGCGAGGTTLAAARIATGGSVLGVDLSGQMLAAARGRAAAAGLRQVTFAQADAQVYAFRQGDFDLAISRFGVMFFADPAAAFARIAGALRPGGRLAFLCWRGLPENPYLSVPFGALAPYVQLPDLGAPGAPGPFSLEDADRIRALLAGAGFQRIAVRAVNEPLWMGADPDDVVASLLEMPMSRAMFEGIGAERRDEALAALRGALAGHQGPDGVLLGGAAWLVTAVRP
ncbi:class I SAM-dependent methyltransferase [Streptomyces sp. NPDC056411]|uniref:class I SAM-dependent methyltransferase n=1 Tax=Streptomyces sp. NPDC056411 TaxID=3345813 RepID=UPI0035D5F35C